MKSRALVPPARSILTGGSRLATRRGLHSPAKVSSQTCLRETSSVRNGQKLRTHGRRFLSSTSGPPVEPVGEPSVSRVSETPLEEPELEDPVERAELEKGRRTRRTTRAVEAEREVQTPLPTGLKVLWTPGELESASSSSSSTSTSSSSSPDANPAPPHNPIPPPDLFTDVLNNLIVTLHPHIQHRATYATASSSAVEPTLALYCPLEGGDYIIDETVKELARRTGSEVVVLDAVQLAGGEWGEFGKAASVLQLPQNPLHFRAPTSRSNRSPSREAEEWDTDDDDFFPGPSQMTLHVMAHGVPVRGGKSPVLTPTRGSSSSKIKAFFDDLINVPSSEPDAAGRRRPRLVYIRDYPTLAPSASVWYPPLLASVRQRRQGPIPRQTSPISNPMTIIFGMTPPIVPPSSGSSEMGPQNIMGLMVSRQSTSTLMNKPPSRSKGGSIYGEDETADKARERRLRERLRKWEREDPSFWDDVPKVPPANGSNEGSPEARTGMVVVGSGMGGLPPAFPPSLVSSLQGQARPGSAEAENPGSTHFFRSSVVVPATRSVVHERICRMARRREMNEIIMRMAIGAVGGSLDKLPEVPPSHTLSLAEEAPPHVEDPEVGDFAKMWSDWGKHVEVWSTAKSIADRAVGAVVAGNTSADSMLSLLSPSKNTLDPTIVNWDSVSSAWAANRASKNVKKAWLNETTGKTAKERYMEEEEGDKAKGDGREVDDIVQHVKNDPELTPHEQRLLNCIVDSGTMPTSFNQVHLPPHTIDSVRTIVSLPILHPSAFQQGILKEHGMTGCLLFGPPGTGKTLVVRALAKEAGCRMLAVAPSDVMDMYVGEGEKLVRSVFSLARRLSPCVVFLDEIDALFGARMSTRETGGAIAHRGVITEFMQEMDGLKTTRDTNVVVIGATNRPFDLDDAVLRRLPRRLLVDLPGERERAEILKILLRDEQLGEDVDIQNLAKRTPLFSGSDLKHLCVSAALDAVKEGVALPWSVPPQVDTSGSLDKPTDGAATAATGGDQPSNDSSATSSETNSSTLDDTTNDTNVPVLRTLHLRHFNKALREITPSSSEALGSLSALRKWNEEFGEGQNKKRKVMWGKGLFGFSEPSQDQIPDGKVSSQERTEGVESQRDVKNKR